MAVAHRIYAEALFGAAKGDNFKVARVSAKGLKLEGPLALPALDIEAAGALLGGAKAREQLTVAGGLRAQRIALLGSSTQKSLVSTISNQVVEVQDSAALKAAFGDKVLETNEFSWMTAGAVPFSTGHCQPSSSCSAFCASGSIDRLLVSR